MKNKFCHLMILLMSAFCINTAHCQETVSETCIPEMNFEVAAPAFGVCDHYRYVSVGVGPIIFIPNLGVGYRERRGQYGWDTAASFSTIGYVHQLSASLVGHYYLNQFQQNSAYLGFGLLTSGIISNDGDSYGTLSPDFVFGKELERKDNNRHFIEMHIAAPSAILGKTHHSHSHCRVHGMYLPLMYVKYGISF